MAFLITSLFILSVAVVTVKSCGKSSVTLVNNGYREVLIGISEKVEEDPQLIVRIKEIFTEASQFLYEATRRRAFFEKVKILIPSNWTSYPNATPSTDGISKSDFLIGNPDSQKDLLGLADIPFVVKATGCGEPGYFVHLTPNYILNETIGKLFGPYGKTLVHEWAHYRWGVYDEYPVDESAPQFYAAQNGIYEGTRCSLASPGFEFNPINGTGCAYIDGKPEPDCIWKDQETGVIGRQGSLMYKHSLYHILEFCDNDETNKFTLHNRDAPTQQNKQCDGKSIWEVMKEHMDFANGVNSPRKLSSTQPEFNIVKAGMRTKRTVLVLDKSGSMSGDRIALLRQVCNNYITSWIPDGEELAVVTFDTTARVVEDLVVVSNTTRSVLLNAIPSTTGGNTAIGQGIQAALRLLARGTSLEGGNIIVVSDGRENIDPRIPEVLPDILIAKVVVHTIAISVQAANTMEEAARQTGGSTFFLSTDGSIASNAINEALREIAQRNLDEDQKDFGLDSTAISLEVGTTVLRSVVIDSTLGLNTKFIFDYSGNTPTFTVTSPSGDTYDQNSPVVNCNSAFRVCSLYIDSVAEAGTWTYNVTNDDVAEQRIAITVTSQSSGGSEPISAQAFWGDSEIDLANGTRKQILYASVSQGYTPILRADVLATVERPDGRQVTVQLKDSGIGADVIKDDGVYSAYFLAFRQIGRYGVQVIVNSTDATTINHGRILGMSAGPSNASGVQDIPVDSFQRQVTGGSFQLDNFIPGQPVYDPGRITDLQVTSINYTQQTVTLEWTAVGKELDQGQASSYELRYATSFAPLRNNFSSQAQVTSEMILNNKTLDEPRLSGEKEMFTIVMPSNDFDDNNITYIFGVIVWHTDGRNAQSPLSNLVSASMLFREHPAPLLPDGSVDGSQNPEPDNVPTTTRKPSTVSKQPGVNDQGSERTTTSASDDRTDDEDHEPRRDEELIIKTMRRPGSNAEISSESIIAMAVGLTVSVLALVGGVFLIVKYHGKRKLMHNEEHFPVPAIAGMRDQPVPIERNRRASFPLRFPRFLPGVNQRPREFAWREVERRRRNELPPDIIRGNGLGIYDDLP